MIVIHICITDKNDYTALIIASQEGSYNASRVLVKHGCNIGYKTKGEGGWGYTALTVACARGMPSFIFTSVLVTLINRTHRINRTHEYCEIVG